MKTFYTTKEYRDKLKQARLLRKQKLGYINSPETREKMRLAKLGKPSKMKPMLGKKHTQETKEKMRKSHSGDKHWNWKGDDYVRKIRDINAIEYKQWRKAVYERDNYTCVLCKKVGGKINAHHIKSWIEYPELRFDTSNGITVCFTCHLQTPNYGGKNKK